MVAVFLLIGGGGVAYWNYKQGRPCPMWVALPLNPQLSVERREEAAKDLKTKVGTKEILARISKDLNLTKKWRMASDDESVAELGRRLFVKVGEMDSPMGTVPSINIGVQGSRKDKGVSEEIATHLMADVKKLLKAEATANGF